jgi:isoamylase
VPMLLFGDEVSRSQGGNNNTYCQDNEIAWLDWESVDGELLDFTRSLVALRAEHPVFRQRRWFQGRELRGGADADIGWFTPGGDEMDDEDWNTGFAKSLTVFLNGDAITAPGSRGERIVDATFLLLLNAHSDAVEFALPAVGGDRPWSVVVDTEALTPVAVSASDVDQTVDAEGTRTVAGRSIVVLRQDRDDR